MGLAEILLGIALPLLLGIGATLAVSDANAIEFWVARGCFMLAALDAVFFTVKWLWLGEPLDARKIVVGALIAAATLICLVYSLRWVDYREERIITVLLPGSKPMPEMRTLA